MARQSLLLLNNFHLGGIADSKYSGIPNSLASMVGLNVHGEPGVMKVNQALVKDSGTTIDEPIVKIISCSNGLSYYFGKTTGKIWSRTSLGVYVLEATDANGGILGAAEFDNYLYYATATKLGRWAIGSAWGTRNDNFATFSNGNLILHPMFVKNQVLYIGDSYYVAQVDGGVFTADALDLEKKYIIKSLGEYEADLLIGTYISTNVNDARVFRWNTIQVSFTNDDWVPEQAVNCFIPTDNFVLVQVGQKGNLYTYNGADLEQFKRIQGDWSNTNQAAVFPDAALNANGLPLFGLSNGSGNPVLQGVYSFGSYSSNYPKILNLEYVLSPGNTNNVDIYSMAYVGNDILIAWRDYNTGSVYGVDKVDWTTKKNGAYFETRVLTLDRMNGKDMDVKLAYRSLPANCSLSLKKSVNGAAYVDVVLRKDAAKALYMTDVKVAGAGSVQFKVIFNTSGNTAPELEAMEISYP